MVVFYCMWCFAFIGLICIALICLFDCVIEISFGFWLRDIYNKGYMSRTCSSIVIKYRIFYELDVLESIVGDVCMYVKLFIERGTHFNSTAFAWTCVITDWINYYMSLLWRACVLGCRFPDGCATDY